MPENSLPAIRKAAEEGYGIEFDIQVTKDGVPVVFHDFTLHRMCGQRGRVCDYTLEELRKFHLLDCGEKIPTFAEALAAVDGRVPLIIEMKVEYADLRVCRAADRLLRDYHGVYCIESFNPLILLWYRRHRPEVMRGQLSDSFIHEPQYRSPIKGASMLPFQFLLANFLSKPDFIAYNHLYEGNISRKLCRKLYKAKAAAWTIQSQEQLSRAAGEFDVFIFDSFIPEGPDRR
jgi:glycerophosphoryl diester phosphodiesterase